jgi:hypothetical protein
VRGIHATHHRRIKTASITSHPYLNAMTHNMRQITTRSGMGMASTCIAVCHGLGNFLITADGGPHLTEQVDEVREPAHEAATGGILLQDAPAAAGAVRLVNDGVHCIVQHAQRLQISCISFYYFTCPAVFSCVFTINVERSAPSARECRLSACAGSLSHFATGLPSTPTALSSMMTADMTTWGSASLGCLWGRQGLHCRSS